MKLVILPIVIYIFFVNISYATIKVNYLDPWTKCEVMDFLQEINKVSKIDSANSVIAKYCLQPKKDNSWELLLYEKIIPLTIKVQKECKSYSLSGTIDLEHNRMFFGNLYGAAGFCNKTCIGSKEACESRKECKININEKYDIYDYITTFRMRPCFEKIDMNKISYLFNKYLPIKWDLEISCDDEETPVTGNHYIYISEVCSEEQMRKIEGYKKNEENKPL